MVVAENSTLVSFDADAAVAAAREVGDGSVHLCVEYTPERFRTLYADELTTGLYGDREEMAAHFEEVHSYVHIDFTEQELFGDLFRAGDEVRAFVTMMDRAALIRVIDGTEGLFLSADPDADVTALVAAVEGALD